MTRLLLIFGLLGVTLIATATGWAETEVTNPLCLVEPTEDSLPEYHAEHGGQTYFFCCSECVELFDADPDRYLESGSDASTGARSGLQLAFDQVWNTASQTPALSIGGLGLACLLIARLALPKLRPMLGMQTFTAAIAIIFGAEALSAHQRRLHGLAEKEEADLIHQVHFSTFHEYGDPPIPEKPDLSPRLSATYYRGNDERSEQLYNGGFYRTCDFNIDLCDADGHPLTYGDPVAIDGLFLRIRITRAPGTPDFFWTPDRMANIFASRDPGKRLGLGGATVPDAVPMEVVRPMREWLMLYRLAPFADPSRPDQLAGIVYHCEKRFGRGERQIGSRFHYAFQFDLELADSRLQAGSDLWMGSTYRNRALRIWEIPAGEWLSTEPIPVIEGENLTTDPKLLGIEGHQLDQN